MENIESIEQPYIYLFSVKEWKDASEMQFEVDTTDPIKLREFVTEQIEKAFLLLKGTDEYNRYFGYRHDLLKRHGRINMLGSLQEKDHLVELSLKEISNEKMKASKKGLVRNNLFSMTGVSCFTADKNTIEDRFHWGAFTGMGEGFCVEYDWPLLEKYFVDTNAGIRGDYVRYYEKGKPKLILQSGYSQVVIDNYCDIIFSLRQLMKDEKEFRMAKVYGEDIPDKDDRRKQAISSGAIQTIFLGPKMAPLFKEKLLGVVKSNLPSVKLMMIEESSGEYKAIAFQAKWK